MSIPWLTIKANFNLQGISGTLSLITLPALLILPSATSASSTFTFIRRHLTTLRGLAVFSATSFITAYSASPRGLKHPYLIYTTVLVSAAGFYDLALNPAGTKAVIKQDVKVAEKKAKLKKKEGKKKVRAMMEASYEVLGDTPSEEEIDDVFEDEEINGEKLRSEMVGFAKVEKIRGGISALGFLLACVGLWGDGAH